MDISDTITNYTKGVIVMFDVNDRQSYNTSIELMQAIHSMDKHLPLVWVGNKSDIKDRAVSQEEIKRSARGMFYNEVATYHDVSAKTASGIYNPLNELLSIIDPKLSIVEKVKIEDNTQSYVLESYKHMIMTLTPLTAKL